MRILVCGGRDFDDWSLFCEGMYKNIPVGRENLDKHTIIQGGQTGADFCAKLWAKWLHVKMEEYKADWNKYHKAAGPIRNKQMLDEGKPDLVIAFPGGKGTANMIQLAEETGVKVIKI